MSRTVAIGSLLFVLSLGSAQAEEPMCLEKQDRSGAAASFSDDQATRCEPTSDEVVLFIRRDPDRQAFLMEALRSEMNGAQAGDVSDKPGSVRYSISDNVTAAMSYSHAFLFDTASDEELRKSRVGSFSTARERDVLGIGMDWGVGANSKVGIGYQLQSMRPDDANAQAGAVSSVLPRIDTVDHAFTLGVTRSWGGTSAD